MFPLFPDDCLFECLYLICIASTQALVKCHGKEDLIVLVSEFTYLINVLTRFVMKAKPQMSACFLNVLAYASVTSPGFW